MTTTSLPTGPLGQPSRTGAATAPALSRRRVPRAVPRWWRDASGALFWLVNLTVVALWVAGGGLQDLAGLGSGLTSVGRLTGLVASALLLVQVFLMARVPWFEQAWGQDELARTHRWVGFTSFTLMLAHIGLVVLGYAADTRAGILGTAWDMLTTYPGMALAAAGTACLVMVVVTSLRRARARLRYESWHLIHLYGYLGAGLALPHQLWSGQEFQSSEVAATFWWGLYAVCAGAVLVFRVGLPLWRSVRGPIHVTGVRRDAHDVVTVTVGGPGVERLAVRGGQFFQWRFLDGPGWSRAHPYSLSAAPDGRSLRFTAQVVGDGTARLTTLRPGTRVLLEGPYGRLHTGVRTQRKVLLMGSGIGITPMRALLEELTIERDGHTGGLPVGAVTVVHRVRRRADAVLGGELGALAEASGAAYIVVDGPRAQGRETWLPQQAAHLGETEALLRLVPDARERDIFLCGSPAWMDAARAAALGAGVPAGQIHLERFAY